MADPKTKKTKAETKALALCEALSAWRARVKPGAEADAIRRFDDYIVSLNEDLWDEVDPIVIEPYKPVPKTEGREALHG